MINTFFALYIFAVIMAKKMLVLRWCHGKFCVNVSNYKKKEMHFLLRYELQMTVDFYSWIIIERLDVERCVNDESEIVLNPQFIIEILLHPSWDNCTCLSNASLLIELSFFVASYGVRKYTHKNL